MRISAAVALLLLTACAPTRMAVPPDLAKDGEALPISERSSWSGALADESFKLGPYRVVDVDRKWDSNSSTSLGPYGSSKSEGGYTFTFKTPAGDARGTCAIVDSAKGVDFGGLGFGKNGSTFTCRCEGVGAQADLALGKTSDQPFGGPLGTRSGRFEVNAVHDDDKGNTRGNALGFAVRSTDFAGAVEIERPGRVWLARTLDASARADVACVFAGLLLYLPPGGSTLAQ